MSTYPEESSGPTRRGGAPDGLGAALVLSLDFELLWGVRDSVGAAGGYRANLLGAREAIPRMLELFAAFDIGVTWAVVGFLFAEGREELAQFSPTLKPTYLNPLRDPYRVTVGSSEKDDPLHFAPSLIRQIAAVPRQEIASHTFSHYYCLEPGQTVEQFQADLNAAVSIAAAKGFALRSLVVPRHQVRPDYFAAIKAAGFHVHRTHERNFLTVPGSSSSDSSVTRLLRLADSYLPLTGANSVTWDSTLPDGSGLVDIHESRFLRPSLPPLEAMEGVRLRRLVAAMRRTALNGQIFHLWWHPHNFGTHLKHNLASLRSILGAYRQLNEQGLMRSLNMAELADIVVAGRDARTSDRGAPVA